MDAARERRVAVVIVHYANLEDTRACVSSLEAAGSRARIYVVDNSPRKETMGEWKDAVRTLDAGGNRGFAGGANVGIKAAFADGMTDIVLLNPDATVTGGWLPPLLAASEDPRIGVATGKVVYPGATRIWAAGGAWDAAKGMGVNRGEGDLDSNPKYASAEDVHWASGCFLLVKREVLEKVGFLDERFFLYMEDVQFCDRVRAAGYRIRYEPRSVVVHKAHGSVGGTPDDPGPALVYYLTRNRVLYARERLQGVDRKRVLARLVVTRFLKMLGELVRGRAGRASLIYHALSDGLAGKTGRSTAVS